MKPRHDLDRSVAFSVLIDVDAEFADSPADDGRMVTAFLDAWYADPSLDMHEFGVRWVARQASIAKTAELVANEMTPEQVKQLTDMSLSFDTGPLHPDLVPWVQEGEPFASLRHPLVYEVPYFSEHSHANQVYAHKRKRLAEAMEEQDWSTVVWLHERPYRAEALDDVAWRIEDDADYWNLVRDVWMDTENLRQWDHLIENLLHPAERGEPQMMDDDEQAALAAMGDPITVWRGHSQYNAEGWSWTVDRERAEWFARRLLHGDKAPLISKGRVRRRDVLAYLTGRGEAEIVVDPADVEVISTIATSAWHLRGEDDD